MYFYAFFVFCILMNFLCIFLFKQHFICAFMHLKAIFSMLCIFMHFLMHFKCISMHFFVFCIFNAFFMHFLKQHFICAFILFFFLCILKQYAQCFVFGRVQCTMLYLTDIRYWNLSFGRELPLPRLQNNVATAKTSIANLLPNKQLISGNLKAFVRCERLYE